MVVLQTLTAAIHCIGNIAKGSNAQTQAVTDCGAVPALASLLGHRDTHVSLFRSRASTVAVRVKQCMHADMCAMLGWGEEADRFERRRAGLWATSHWAVLHKSKP